MENVHAKSTAAARAAQKLSPSEQYAIVSVLPNIMNGAFWGFTMMSDIKQHVEVLRASGGNIAVRQLGNACLLEVQPSFLLDSVASIDNSLLTQKDLQVMNQKRAEAGVSFEKFLIQKGKSSEKTGKLFGGAVGIYCINEVTTINNRGVSYPAFRIDMGTTLRLLKKYNYLIKVGNNFVDPVAASNMGQALWSSVVLSPTKTGLFINIMCQCTAEQMKMLENQFKAEARR